MDKYFVYTDNMAVGYEGKPLIQNIEIKLEKGQILTLIGPNGAGKSTILKSITRQLKLVGGTVYLDRELMNKMTGKEIAKKL
ncbi:MAG TPA: ABC transporter ATP-binding protein, partial [Candidatus Blautia faecigallinarum]|nr:ABC transporter ATP-binding protein [Candidatus Blautia faecigallinarum]